MVLFVTPNAPLGGEILIASSEGKLTVEVGGKRVVLPLNVKALKVVSPSASVQLKVGLASKNATVCVAHVAAFA